MRRLLLVLLLALLPLQWSWAAAGSVCAHEAGPSTHFGHHAHQHDHDHAFATERAADEAPSQVHHDCGVCQAFAAAFVPGTVALPQATPPQNVFVHYNAHVPDRVPEGLLRPPHRAAA